MRKAEASTQIMRLWFTEGWAGNDALADEIFSDEFSNNGVVVGPAGPKRNIRNRLIGFPDLQSVVEQLFAIDEIVFLRLSWTGTHTGSYLGVAATGKRVRVRGMTTWRFQNGKVVEDWTTGHIPLEIFGVELAPPVPARGREQPLNPRLEETDE